MENTMSNTTAYDGYDTLQALCIDITIGTSTLFNDSGLFIIRIDIAQVLLNPRSLRREGKNPPEIPEGTKAGGLFSLRLC